MHELPSFRLFWKSAASPMRTRVQGSAPRSSKSCQQHCPFLMGRETSQKTVTAAYVNGAAAVRAEPNKPPNGQSQAGVCWVLFIFWGIIDSVFCGRSMFSCRPRELLCSPSGDSVQLMDNPWAWLRKPQRKETLFSLTVRTLSWFWPLEFLFAAAFHASLPHALPADHLAERLWADASLPTFNRVPVLLALLSSTMCPELFALVTQPVWPSQQPYVSEPVHHLCIGPLESISGG